MVRRTTYALFTLPLALGCGTDAGDDAGVPDEAGTMLEVCAVSAAFEVDALMAPARDSDAYVQPDATRVAQLERSIRAAIAGEEGDAAAEANGAGYRLCAGEGDEAGVLLWTPLTPDEGAARIALRPDGVGLILEAPHPLFDSDTGAQASELFTTLGARALIVSGTHRCASATATPCDGRTSVCVDGGAPYPISDAAHDVTGTFHAAHVALAEGYPDDRVVSVHGMSGAGVSVSDGTTAPTVAASFAARLAAALATRFSGVTSCNEGASVPHDERLCGTTNVQGRHVNGAADACTEGATSASGRFVHIEQSREVRGRVADVAMAFADVLR